MVDLQIYWVDGGVVEEKKQKHLKNIIKRLRDTDKNKIYDRRLPFRAINHGR